VSIIKYFRPLTKAKLLRGERVHWIENNKRARYIRQCVLSFPPWVDREQLKALWQKCRDMERATGVAYTLGHQIPLSHPRVSGLSVPWNLKPEPAAANFSKGNAWCEWHGDLFSDPEQLRLF
jgi:hypothetical protein